MSSRRGYDISLAWNLSLNILKRYYMKMDVALYSRLNEIEGDPADQNYRAKSRCFKRRDFPLCEYISTNEIHLAR